MKVLFFNFTGEIFLIWLFYTKVFNFIGCTQKYLILHQLLYVLSGYLWFLSCLDYANIHILPPFKKCMF